MQAKCPVSKIKKSRFLKEQEANGLLTNLGIKTLLIKCFVLSVKMNEIVNDFLLATDRFMPEMHLKQPGFTYSACGPFTKNKGGIECLRKLKIQTLFTEMILIKLVFNMIWLMANQKI